MIDPAVRARVARAVVKIEWPPGPQPPVDVGRLLDAWNDAGYRIEYDHDAENRRAQWVAVPR